MLDAPPSQEGGAFAIWVPMFSDHEAVSELLRSAAREEIVPRFGQLGVDDVISKATREDPHDIVTVADRAAEARITAGLLRLLPGSIVIGEEATSADPTLLAKLDSDAPLWVVDPIDGTKNFASGNPEFAVMLALIEARQPVASWIYFPIAESLFFASAGGGAFENGSRISAPSAARGTPQGALYTRYAADGAALAERAGRLWLVPPAGCAGTEYTAVASGRRDFVVYHRLLPWDHVPGALIVREAGGVVRHGGGAEYTPSSPDQPTLAAGSEAVWNAVAAELFGA